MMLGRFDRGDVSKKYRVPDHRAMHTQGWADQHFIKCM